VYEKLSVTDLRAEIQNRGLSCKAEKKADLVDFLKSHDHESETPSLKSPSTNESGEKPTVSSEEKKKVKEESFEEVDRGRLHAEQMKELRKIVLWRKPLTTLLYFVFELRIEVARLVSSMLAHKITMVGVVMALMMFAVTYYWDGPHQSFVSELERQILWCSYWVGLGILSSVGLGTGLHTFLLYLVSSSLYPPTYPSPPPLTLTPPLLYLVSFSLYPPYLPSPPFLLPPAGTSHSLCDPGSVELYVSGLPRTTLPQRNPLSIEPDRGGVISSCSNCECVLHSLQSQAGSFHVGCRNSYRRASPILHGESCSNVRTGGGGV
jgi:hypothetical protein